MYQNLNVIIIDPYVHTIELRRLNSNTRSGIMKEIESLFSGLWMGYIMKFDNTDWIAANIVMNVGGDTDRQIFKTRRIRGRAIVFGMYPTLEFKNPLTTPDDLATKIHFCSPKRSHLSILWGRVNSFYISGVRYLEDSDAQIPNVIWRKPDLIK